MGLGGKRQKNTSQTSRTGALNCPIVDCRSVREHIKERIRILGTESCVGKRGKNEETQDRILGLLQEEQQISIPSPTQQSRAFIQRDNRTKLAHLAGISGTKLDQGVNGKKVLNDLIPSQYSNMVTHKIRYFT